ncbi:hypothetical protein SDC9_127081 [bioreactor metagenome]|uniref:Uncharacterized protein n=1 Tax=bioreactor metagenome TaxID=1076179 RepID=A0A645CSY2_9ZZZZ
MLFLPHDLINIVPVYGQILVGLHKGIDIGCGYGQYFGDNKRSNTAYLNT